MTQTPIPGLGLPSSAEMTDSDWFAKSLEINELFNPSAPVQETELFAGRRAQMDKILDSVFQVGQHIVVYGDRGVGKTSLLNIVRNKIFGASSSNKIFLVTQCLENDDYINIWERTLKNHRWSNGDYAIDDIDSAANPDSIYDILERFNANEGPIIIFDEFDRITDKETKVKVAETIKLLSDRASHSTIIVAGVSRTIRDLISEHESIRRALRQIEMPRMVIREMQDLLKFRLIRVNMTMDSGVEQAILWFAHGMPGYAQLLGKYAAKSAINHKRLNIIDEDLFGSLNDCLEETFESTRHAYYRATHSTQPNALLRESLLACAITPQDEIGSFTAAAVRNPLSKIMGKERDIPDFSRHLKSFCSAERGPILERQGSHKNYHYRFIDPMMQPYIITKGVKDGLLKPNPP